VAAGSVHDVISLESQADRLAKAISHRYRGESLASPPIANCDEAVLLLTEFSTSHRH